MVLWFAMMWFGRDGVGMRSSHGDVGFMHGRVDGERLGSWGRGRVMLGVVSWVLGSGWTCWMLVGRGGDGVELFRVFR